MRKLSLWPMAALIILLTLLIFPAAGAGQGANNTENNTGSGPAGPVAGRTPTYNDCALFIAGIGNPAGPLAAYENQSAWTRYARFINRSWERFEKSHLGPMSKWASQELNTAKTETAFYPFSGPDFVNLYTLFPQAKTYLLIALEPVGGIPDFASTENNYFFPQLERSLYDLLQLNFFITHKLRGSLGKQELKGVLPILLFFLAREKAQVLDVKYWVMKPEGAIEVSPAVSPMLVDAEDIGGVRIDFTRAGPEAKQTLYYFRFNLGNDSLQKNGKLVSFLKGFGPVTTFAKAASYLMHRPEFSGIRQLILEQSNFVLAGDSAIPVRYFDRTTWNLRFFGTYRSPIDLFKCFRQKDLAEIYEKGADVYPLPFGIDYRHRVNTSNLLFASKKVALAANE